MIEWSRYRGEEWLGQWVIYCPRIFESRSPSWPGTRQRRMQLPLLVHILHLCSFWAGSSLGKFGQPDVLLRLRFRASGILDPSVAWHSNDFRPFVEFFMASDLYILQLQIFSTPIRTRTVSNFSPSVTASSLGMWRVIKRAERKKMSGFLSHSRIMWNLISLSR